LNDRNWDLIEKLEAFASSRGRSLLDLAFGWLLSQDRVTSVIAGATRPEQLEANVTAGLWRLTQDDLEAIDHIGV
jgi:aryl-alcohol dehydrogenase-like predicted oxidoreductase